MTIYRDDMERIYKLLEKPEAWTKGAYARDAAGELIPDERGDTFEDDESASLRDEAACWCLYGAAIRCGVKLNALDEVMTVGDIVSFNDSPATTHSDVLAALHTAINRAPVRT